MVKKRRVFEQGHRRKFLVIIDESPEVETALFFAASRISHTGGQIVLLYVIEPHDFTQWAGVQDIQLEEETTKAKALFRLYRRKLDKRRTSIRSRPKTSSAPASDRMKFSSLSTRTRTSPS